MRPTAALERLARDVASIARERRRIRDLECAIRHLEARQVKPAE
jgi:hypothetical protein